LPQLWATGTAFSCFSAVITTGYLRLFCSYRHLCASFTLLVLFNSSHLKEWSVLLNFPVTTGATNFLKGLQNYSGCFKMQRVLLVSGVFPLHLRTSVANAAPEIALFPATTSAWVGPSNLPVHLATTTIIYFLLRHRLFILSFTTFLTCCTNMTWWATNASSSCMSSVPGCVLLIQILRFELHPCFVHHWLWTGAICLYSDVGPSIFYDNLFNKPCFGSMFDGLKVILHRWVLSNNFITGVSVVVFFIRIYTHSNERVSLRLRRSANNVRFLGAGAAVLSRCFYRR